MDHISDDDLERFHLGKITDDAELAIIEEHLLWCSRCIDAAEEAAQYVDAMRVRSFVEILTFSGSSRNVNLLRRRSSLKIAFSSAAV